ncbi:hypothetical protein M2R47_09320, partial [Moraxella sp. Tifton1]|nr:hypothetical protein [Moraxella sp. Tifton1]
QAGLSHINTENFNQPEVQDELNQIIANDFDKEQALKELNAQTVITTEFGREAPKVVADFSKDQIKRIASDPNLTPEEKTTEQQKWAEGGIYRVALHTAVGVIGTGTIEGAVTTGSIAASAPIIDKLSEQTTKQLVKAGISEDTAQNATSLITSLAIATATQSAGVDTSSTVMAVNADAFNRQLHKQEKDLAGVLVDLAKKKGLKRPDGKLYTRQDIEDALRWANSGKYGETYNSNRAVHIGNKAPQSAIDKVMYDGGVGRGYDARLWISSKNGNVTTFTQNLNNIKKPDTNLTRFIQQNSKSYQYSWSAGTSVAYIPPITATQPISPAKKISGSQSQISDRQLRSKDSAVINGGGGVDFSGGANIQAKSEKIINEQVMPVVQAGVGLAEVGTGTAMCASGVGCGIGSALIIHGSDNVATGATNRGKTSNQQTSSVLLTQGVGLSEGTASNIKMGTDLALGGVTATQGLGRRV